jgi:hypothetical protein
MKLFLVRLLFLSLSLSLIVYYSHELLSIVASMRLEHNLHNAQTIAQSMSRLFFHSSFYVMLLKIALIVHTFGFTCTVLIYVCVSFLLLGRLRSFAFFLLFFSLATLLLYKNMASLAASSSPLLLSIFAPFTSMHWPLLAHLIILIWVHSDLRCLPNEYDLLQSACLLQTYQLLLKLSSISFVCVLLLTSSLLNLFAFIGLWNAGQVAHNVFASKFTWFTEDECACVPALSS